MSRNRQDAERDGLALEAEATRREQAADDLAEIATLLRRLGYRHAAARVLSSSRRHRVVAIERFAQAKSVRASVCFLIRGGRTPPGT